MHFQRGWVERLWPQYDFVGPGGQIEFQTTFLVLFDCRREIEIGEQDFARPCPGGQVVSLCVQGRSNDGVAAQFLAAPVAVNDDRGREFSCGGGNNGRPCRGGGCKRGHLHPLITLQFEQNCTGNRLLPDLSNRGFGWCRWLQGNLWFIGTFVVVRRPVRPSAVKKRIGPMPAASRCVMERCSAKVDQPTPAGGNGKPSPVLHGDRGLLHPRNPHSVLS